MAAPAFYLLTYDIADDKRRLRIAKLMESVGERVQHSVFEAYLTPQQLEKLLKRIGKTMSAKEDSLRIYQLCASCREKVRTEGQGTVTPPPGVMIV
ncbi:MAG: CRISPR-associated endonuclease Cas2 [Anaerolineae bacterium]|nr:CRISPR-associated endonuclease Cas2 [Anaerolineae bacterium]MCB0206655.1 CRISPR-associated endonuclease Cas2 [Anaerolineae bacterium]MCB0256074.1 CRISPR-associated endonuclease Cas2 [Anaerolineae bacterium]